MAVLVAVVGGCGGGQPTSTTPEQRSASMSGATNRVAAQVIEEAAPQEQASDAIVFTESRRKRTRRGEVYVPEGFAMQDGTYDLVIHFHGAFETVEPAFQASNVRAVLFTMNLGNGSGPYEERFRLASSFPGLLADVQQAVANTLGNPDARMRRIALSSWSAGYGAVARILARPENAGRVDSVLLADSMHASLLDQRARTVYDASLAPFTRFAEQAVAGQKLMVIAHSSIATTTYASTTEAARRLADEVDVMREPACEASPAEMTMISCADGGELHIRGFAGRDATAHVDHLRHIDETLLGRLRERWTS